MFGVRSAGSALSRRTTKNMAKSITASGPILEIGLVCGAGSSLTGVHGLTDLFQYAGDFAAKRRQQDATARLRTSHWKSDATGSMSCTYDTHPSIDHRPSVLVSPSSLQAALDSTRDEVLKE
jgi:transcriptional regulator GlxA family with amidase domain